MPPEITMEEFLVILTNRATFEYKQRLSEIEKLRQLYNAKGGDHILAPKKSIDLNVSSDVTITDGI